MIRQSTRRSDLTQLAKFAVDAAMGNAELPATRNSGERAGVTLGELIELRGGKSGKTNLLHVAGCSVNPAKVQVCDQSIIAEEGSSVTCGL
jgi:hypothetical protein